MAISKVVSGVKEACEGVESDMQFMLGGFGFAEYRRTVLTN